MVRSDAVATNLNSVEDKGRDSRYGSIATDAYAAGVASGPKWPKSGLRGPSKNGIFARAPSRETCPSKRGFASLTLIT